MAKAKKITQAELASANELIEKINVYSNRIKDLQIALLDHYPMFSEARQEFQVLKQSLEEKYGKETQIDLKTGEISKQEAE